MRDNNAREPTSCAYCDCPSAGWGGVSCEVCRDVSVCEPRQDGSGELVAATGCTTASLVPTEEELDAGKSISCTCGGDDATEQLCQLLPETRILVTLGRDSALRDMQQAALRLYAGMPSQVVAPNYTQYAYPAYWSANFTSCAWVEKPCLDPLPATQRCLFFLCSNGTVACPPPEIPPCPGYDRFPFLCDPDENGVRPFQHHCNPLIVPNNDSMSFYCSMNTVNDTWLCYFRQPMKAAIALQCITGQCVYKDLKPPPTPGSDADFWTGELVTLLFMAALLLILLAGASKSACICRCLLIL